MAKSIQSLERAAAVLQLLAGGGPALGLSEIATALGLAKGTAHGLLRTLHAEGLVEQEGRSGRYRLGPELLRLGAGYLDAHELRSRAAGLLEELARETGESAVLGVLHRRGVLVLHHAVRPGGARRPPEAGAVLPLCSTALGRVLSAYDERARAAAAREWAAGNGAGGEGEAEFAAVLAETARRGWAQDVEEAWDGVASVAAPVRDRRGAVVGAVAVSGPADRVCPGGRPGSTLVAAVGGCARTVFGDSGDGRI